MLQYNNLELRNILAGAIVEVCFERLVALSHLQAFRKLVGQSGGFFCHDSLRSSLEMPARAAEPKKLVLAEH